MRRKVDPADWEPLVDGEEVWSDYDGDEIYGDFTVDGGDVTNERSFELAIGKVDPWTGSGSANTTYYHGDQISSTRFLTGPTGLQVLSSAYTAFGELRPSSTNHRYGYAGAWGYQAPESELPDDPYLDFPFLHVGTRYYDPSTGRFLQRDRIGIAGGLNVYAYARSNPLYYIDPSGLGVWGWIKDKAKKVWDVLKRLPPYILPSSPIPADAAPDMACIYMLSAYRKQIEYSHDDNLQDDNCPTCKRLRPK